MPLYEYQCESCDHRFEVLQRMGEGNEGLQCPRCSAPAPRRRLSTFAAGHGSGSSSSAGSFSAPACGSGFS